MKNLRMPGIALVAWVAMTLSAPAMAVNRCNAKFTFHNQYSFPVTVHGKIEVRGNQGDYQESLDKVSFRVPAGGRLSTRQNRLQKVDAGTRAEFKITVGSQYGNISADINWRAEGLNRTRNINHGTLKPNKLCEDGKFIVFEIKPLRDSPAARTGVFKNLGANRSSPEARARALAREFNVVP